MTEIKLNLVYDYWDGDSPILNGKTHYPTNHFWDIEDFVNNYVNSFSVSQHKIKVKSCKISEVYENPNQKYYYFICHAAINIDDIIKDNKIITNEIKQCLISCDNFNLVFFSHHESDDEDGFKILNNSDLPKKQIYLINNNYKLNEYVSDYNSQIKVYSVMYLPVVVSATLYDLSGTKFSFDKKERFFMCFNRGPKIHRHSLLVFMLKHNLLDESNWSFIPNFFSIYDFENYKQIFDVDEIKNYDKEIKTLNELKLKISDHENTELSFDDNNEITVLNPKYKNVLLPPEIPENYINSYVNLVTETKFLDNENVIQISEKSFKPFFYYQFPMILATHHHIKAMKEKYDFDFFDDVIDHSYDNEPDQKKRFKLFVNEVKRLHDNKENLIEFYRNNQVRFEINKNKVISIMNNYSDYIFFRSLIN
jgi:hypothetical protein